MKQLIFVFLFIIGSFSAFSQTETDIQLAQHYYSNGEFDKATGYYEKFITLPRPKFISIAI